MSTSVQYGRFYACVRCLMGLQRDRGIHDKDHEFGLVRDESEIRFPPPLLSICMCLPRSIALRSIGGAQVRVLSQILSGGKSIDKV